MRKSKTNHLRNALIIVAIILLSIIILSIILYHRSMQPYNEVKADAYQYAKENADIQEPYDFYWYNGEETYYTVVGKNSNGEDIITIIAQNGGQIRTIKVADALTKQEAVQQVVAAKEPKSINQARIGMEQNMPVWEISYKNQNNGLGYYKIHLETGEWISDVDNL